MTNLNILSKISKMSKKEKKLGILAGLFFLLAVGDYVVVQPIRSKVNILSKDVVAHERKIAKNNRILTMKKAVTAEYKENISFIKMTGSDEEEISKFLNEIEVLSRKSEVSLVDMKPHISRDREVSAYKRYFVETEIEASIDRIAGFMFNLQRSPRLLKIEKFSLNTKGEAISELIKGYLTITKIVIPE